MKRMVALLAVLAALVLPASALANGGGSNCQAYNPQTCGTVGAGSAGSGSGGGTLPFTGINVGLLALGGATFLGTGLVVRRLVRESS